MTIIVSYDQSLTLADDQSLTLATFAEELGLLAILSGKETDWTLPEIQNGGSTAIEISVAVHPILREYVEFSSATKQFSYNGEIIEGLLETTFVSIEITLTNEAGSNTIELPVIVYPQAKELSETSDEDSAED